MHNDNDTNKVIIILTETVIFELPIMRKLFKMIIIKIIQNDYNKGFEIDYMKKNYYEYKINNNYNTNNS